MTGGRQLELMPPEPSVIANALRNARPITIAGGDTGAAGGTTHK